MPVPSLNPSLRPRGLAAKGKDAQSRLESSGRAPPEASADADSTPVAILSPQSIPTLQPNNADGGKRRSFLPQPGELRYAPRRTDHGASAKTQAEVSNEPAPSETLTNPGATKPSHEVTVPSSRQGRLRPRSMYQTSSTRPEHRDGEDDRGSSVRDPRLHTAADTSLGRSHSLRKPGTSARPTQPANTRSHLRTQSSSIATSTHKASADVKTQQERPRSLLVPPSNSMRTASKGSADAAAGAVRSTRLEALKRSASVKTKPEATDRSGSTDLAGSVESGQQSSSRTSRLAEPPKHDSRKPARPAFSTLQQHFTPRKTGKAPTSMFLHPPAPDVGAHIIPAEMISLQAELLQLHLFHQTSAEVSRQWELSAKKALHRKFEEVTSLYQVMRDSERQAQEQKNIRALQDWNGDSTSFALAEHVQILSGPLHELPSLVGPGGRYSRLETEFQQWIARIEETWSSRESVVRKTMDLESAEGLGDAWKVENAALTRKLTIYSRELDKLTQPAHGSSIAAIVATCKELLAGMLDELQIMQMIEAGVVATEKDWIEARLKAIAQDIGAHLSNEIGEVWRT